MESNRFKKPLIITLAIIVVLFLAGLIGTPYLIDLGLERWIASQGPEIGKVENVDFNPFTGRLSMDNLVVETQSGRTLNITHAYLQFSWKQLFKKQLYLKELVLQDVFMLVDRLEESGFRVGGLILSELAGSENKSDKPGWEVGIEIFKMQNAKIEYDTPELIATYFIDQYTLKGLETWNKKKPVQMAYQGRINESQVQVQLEVVLLDVVKSWKGNIVLENGSLELVSKVRGLQEYGPKGSIDIDLNLDAQMQEDTSIAFAAEGTASLKQLQLQYEQYGLLQEEFAWKGRIAGNRTAEQKLTVTVDGELSGKSMALDDSVNSLQLMLGAFIWHGKAGISQQNDPFTVTMESEFEGDSVLAKDEQNNMGLLGLEKFNIAGLVIAGLDDIRVAQIDLKNLHLIEKKSTDKKEAKDAAPPLLQTAAVNIDTISLKSGNDLFTGNVKLKDLRAFLHRDKAGNWQVLPASSGSIETAPEQQVPETEVTARDSGPFKIRIGNLQASGKNSIRFEDESLYRPFHTTFHISELGLAGIDTADKNAIAKFNIKGQVGDYGTVVFGGTAKPSEKPVTLDMKGTIGALDMPPFSSYTGQTVGYNVTSGQLDADITMNIDKGMMDSIFDLHMRNLEVAQVDPEKMPEIDSQMNVPLGSALAMLRNKKDEINIKLELKDDINNPQFGIQDAINQALAKAMKFATLSYLKYSLQPFGTYIAIAEVVGKAGKEMSKVALDPMLFPAGEIVLDEKANQYLEKIKELLDNRPKLRIELCGRSVEKDRAALIEKRLAVQKKDAEKSGKKQEEAAVAITIPNEVLLDFAKERAKLVKESLVKQHSINHERIFVCLPEVDEDPAKDPYVEMRLD
jgi:hypothetical protein